MNRALIAAIVAAGILAGLAAGHLHARRSAGAPELERATLYQAPRDLPPFALVDQHGREFGPDRFRGHWTFLFFGFVNCPDVCPTTLATLAAARRTLADLPEDERPGVAFVSVDPGRDTPDLLGRYVAHFDRSFTGATGSADAIAALTGALGVAVMIGPPQDDGSYSVDHTAAVFLVDPDARVTALFGAPHASDAIARDYRRVVAARRG
jgi:protein SCO1/2